MLLCAAKRIIVLVQMSLIGRKTAIMDSCFEQRQVEGERNVVTCENETQQKCQNLVALEVAEKSKKVKKLKQENTTGDEENSDLANILKIGESQVMLLCLQTIHFKAA